MENIVYLDTNFFVHLFLQEEENIKRIMNSLSKLNIYTSVLTYDELIWAIRKLINKDVSLKAAEFILNLDFLHFIDLDKMTINKSLEILRNFDLKPRDCLHFATMLTRDIKHIIGDDGDFDKVKLIKRTNIESFIRNL